MISNGYYFWLGVSVIVIPATLIFAIARISRHSCKQEGCGRHTRKVCKLFRLHELQATSLGKQAYLLYIFRVCRKGHVRCEIKLVWLSALEASMKPKSEFDWGSSEAVELCRIANISRPIIKHPTPGLFMTSNGGKTTMNFVPTTATK